MKVSLSVNGVNKLLKFSKVLQKDMPTLEKRFVDVTLRYGVHPATIDRWKKTLELKNLFEKRIGGSVYTLLPCVLENSFSLEVTV